MKTSNEEGRRPFKPPFLMLAILGIHVAAGGFFMMMSGCSTKPVAVEPPPAPLLPPRQEQAVVAPAPMPKPTFRPPVSVDRAPSSFDAASGSSYTVQKGDSLSKIAARAGVSTAELSELNKITNKDQIRIGQKLLLPAHSRPLPSAPAPASAPKSEEKKSASTGPATASGNSHTVQSGDTLGKLAARYGTSTAAFKSVNNLKSDTIRIGQKLVIPTGKGKESSAPVAAAPSVPAPVVTEAASFVAPEPVIAPAVEPVVVESPAIAAGSVDAAASDADAPFPYNVKDGDTLDSIAIKFSARKDVIMRLNNMTSETVRPGQKLLIPWQ
jgi:LysM repeat protein